MEFEMTKERSSYTPSPQPKMSSPPQRGFLMAQLVLRILAISFTSAAIGIMVTSAQVVSFDGIEMFEAHYTDSSAMRFNVRADAAVIACFLLSLILVIAISCSKSNPNKYFSLFLHDFVVMVLLISGCAAATAVGYVGRYGQIQSDWSPICDHLPKFCHKATLSMAFSYAAFFCCLVLTIMSAYKLKSQTRE